ncbi:MAG: hypothetical protein WCC48_10465 [Anaeromyxobacteraceae bacterium]
MSGVHRRPALQIGETLLAYDSNGNTTRECRDHGDPTCQVDHDHLRELSWNEENRLTSVVEGGGHAYRNETTGQVVEPKTKFQ